jgi:hypothetical protein
VVGQFGQYPRLCNPPPTSHLSSELLHDSIGAVDLYPRRARSEATTSCSARPRSPPPQCTRASPENQLTREGYIYTGRGVAGEHGLVGPARNVDLVDERERQQRQQEDEDNDEDTRVNTLQASKAPLLGSADLCENSVILGMEATGPP